MKGSWQAVGLTEGLYLRQGIASTLNFDSKIKSVRFAAEPPRLPLRRELSSLSAFKGLTEGEITRGRCLLRGTDEHGAKKRSFAFTLAYIKCFRTYSLYLSLRLPAQILYAGIHLCPLAVSRSCFGYSLSHLRTAAACLSRCIRHRRRSKAKPLRGRRGRSPAAHRFFLYAPSNSALILQFVYILSIAPP